MGFTEEQRGFALKLRGTRSHIQGPKHPWFDASSALVDWP